MLVFPQWRSSMREADEGCRAPRWMPADRFAPYLARPVPLPPLPPQVEDEDSSGCSSPERSTFDQNAENSEGFCGWRNCGAQLPSVARLSAHVARTHAISHRDGLFYCGWKGCTRPHKGFNARYKMLVHVRTHTNERPHTCNQCNKSFSRAENLKIHLRSHSGEKPYVCPYEGCGKAYSNSSDRFKHTRTHAVEKPYCCKVPGCNKRYTDPSSLRKHVKTYKHFTLEQIAKQELATHNRDQSPATENSIYNEPSSPNISYNPVKSPVSPVLTYTSVITEPAYTPIAYPCRRATCVRPLESMYPMRVPSNEMSYVEYTQMYEHAYRNYYSNINYPVSTVSNKVFTYEDQPRLDDVSMENVEKGPIKYCSTGDEMPLNLICSKRAECKPIIDLIRRTDLPLDLSFKS